MLNSILFLIFCIEKHISFKTSIYQMLLNCRYWI